MEKKMNPETDLDSLMTTIESGMSAWLDEFEVSQPAAQQLSSYIRAALEWDKAEVVADTL